MIIRSLVLDDLIAHTREAAPAECCGILLGDEARITASVRARNLSDSPVRFLLDPRDHVGAIRRARAEGVQVSGFYHSHPHSRPVPSPTDIEEALYEGSMHLIVSGLEEEPRARLFRMVDGRVEEIVLTIESASADPNPGLAAR